jgi:hypothetical protein
VKPIRQFVLKLRRRGWTFLARPLDIFLTELAMTDDRLDRKLELVVNRALFAARLVDIPTGARIMRSEGCSAETIARVLLHPDHCRATDWKP